MTQIYVTSFEWVKWVSVICFDNFYTYCSWRYYPCKIYIFLNKIEITPYFLNNNHTRLQSMWSSEYRPCLCVVSVNIILIIFYIVCIWHGFYLPACNAPGETLVSSQLTLTYHLRISSYMMCNILITAANIITRKYGNVCINRELLFCRYLYLCSYVNIEYNDDYILTDFIRLQWVKVIGDHALDILGRLLYII